jgi:hypothetical protein
VYAYLRLVVASINTPYVYDVRQLLITFDDLIIQVISAAELLSAYSTLVLPELVKRFLWYPLVHAL